MKDTLQMMYLSQIDDLFDLVIEERKTAKEVDMGYKCLYKISTLTLGSKECSNSETCSKVLISVNTI